MADYWRSIVALCLLASALATPAPANGSELISYTYDDRGRLVRVVRSGTVNDGIEATYSYDKADNRTHVTVSGPSFSVNDISATEGSSLAFSVTRTSTSAPAIVSYTTSGGTATAGSDYAATSGTLNFAIGEAIKPVYVTTVDDSATGGANIANVNQDGLTGVSSVIQTGGSSATVDQNGNDHDSRIDQDGDHTATVIQSGDNNESDIDQLGSGNAADVNQSGADNQSRIGQDGSGLSANVTQSGVNGVVEIGQDMGSSNNSASVTQGGVNNDSFVYQYNGASNNSVDVTQNGSNNATRTVQVGNYNRSIDATNNSVTVNQTATSSNSLTTTAQEGTGNIADIKVSGAGVSVAGRQTTSSGYYNNEPPETDVWQISDNNKAYIDQASDASRVTIYQGLEQPVQGQFGYNLALGQNNYAKVTQTAGADNSRADVIQGGDDNIANVTQSGLNSISYLNQYGTGNDATVIQSSDNNQSFITQNGNGNMASVTQGN